MDRRSLPRERPHNDFSKEARKYLIHKDVLHTKDLLSLANNTIYYFIFDENRKVFNACGTIVRFRTLTKSRITAHRDFVNHIVKVVVDRIVADKR